VIAGSKKSLVLQGGEERKRVSPHGGGLGKQPAKRLVEENWTETPRGLEKSEKEPPRDADVVAGAYNMTTHFRPGVLFFWGKKNASRKVRRGGVSEGPRGGGIASANITNFCRWKSSPQRKKKRVSEKKKKDTIMYGGRGGGGGAAHTRF